MLRLIAAAAGGASLSLSFQPIGWWVLGPLSAALLVLALAGRPRWWLAVVIGLIWGAVPALMSLGWIGEFVGNGPWLALCLTLGIVQIAAALGVWLITNARLHPALIIVGTASWIIAIEAVLVRWPFGGFPWLRHAFGQVGGPIAQTAIIGGAPLVSWLTCLIGTACAVAILRWQPKTWVSSGVVVAIVAALSSAAPLFRDSEPSAEQPGAARSIRVAAVQGNVPRLGLEFNAQRLAVLRNHVDATIELAQRVQAGQEAQPDVVIWPENSADVSPFIEPQAQRMIEQAANAIAAPIIVGTFTYTDGVQNTMVVWDPDTGAGETHEKIHLQPFGEWMPMRDFLAHFSDMVELAGDMKPGHGDTVVHADGIAVGIATCFEVIFDDAYRTAVNNGAQILATPTNNATFGYTDMSYQQLAMSRLRAIEHNRTVVVAATSGVSAIVRPDGTVAASTKIFEQAVLTSTVPLHTQRTIAARWGASVEWGVVIIAMMVAAAAVIRRDSSANS
ncbi:apolipoprotein N-acyltransferase [Corynebacterium sp. TAE3-ERU12]|nr:apolipoprotein N-acyltransferase [Corynebacterium sp. TAE3-ERU12]